MKDILIKRLVRAANDFLNAPAVGALFVYEPRAIPTPALSAAEKCTEPDGRDCNEVSL